MFIHNTYSPQHLKCNAQTTQAALDDSSNAHR